MTPPACVISNEARNVLFPKLKIKQIIPNKLCDCKRNLDIPHPETVLHCGDSTFDPCAQACGFTSHYP